MKTASKNSSNGKPRVLLINRDYSSDKTVMVTLESFVPGDAAVVLYSNGDLMANNETAADTVSVVSSVKYYGTPFVVTVPKHSVMRIDFQ